jgi:6-pyruvoyltetrahydropterin/6-carboxytetrahydropterin synthase
MYTISKEFHFSASHQLTHLPMGHQCARLHGHNYKVVLTLEAEELDDNSFVKDYGQMTAFKDAVDALDHRHLNDLFECHTTAENLASHFYGVAWSQYGDIVKSVAVSETDKTWATFTP